MSVYLNEAKRCDGCGQPSLEFFGPEHHAEAEHYGGDWAFCAKCIDKSYRLGAHPARGCYCKLPSLVCDFCNGYRVAHAPKLGTPRQVQEMAERLNTRPKALSRWTAERLSSAGIEVAS